MLGDSPFGEPPGELLRAFWALWAIVMSLLLLCIPAMIVWKVILVAS